ncbi:MFS transporter [Microbacterium sp. P05]|uniref:MFS transporter n=1 Tax=Microbacterium sp. P05 TaxID=3366948 RepID=UPI0037451B3E
MKRRSPISQAWRSDFRRFWLAQATSLTGEQIRELAVPLVAITVLGASAAELGLIGLAQWAPFLLLALPLGVLADRHRRRRLIALSQWSRGALMLGVVVAAALGALSLPLLLVAVTALGIFAVLYEVCYQSVVPSLVPPAALEGANARLQATASGAEVGGPGLGGLLAQWLGAPIALLAPTIGYVVSGVAVASVRAPEPLPQRPERVEDGRGVFFREMRDGISHVLHDRYLVANVGFSALYNPFAQWITVLFTLHSIRVLGLGAGQIGLVFSLGAVGALVAAALTPVLTRRFQAGHLLLACAAIECGVLAVIPMVEAGWGAPLMIAVLSGVWALNGAGTGISSVLLVTIRQIRTPQRLLGRVNASMRTVTYGTVSLGALAGGLAGDWWGTRAALGLGAGLCLVTVAWVALSPLARIRRLEDLTMTPKPATSVGESTAQPR